MIVDFLRRENGAVYPFIVTKKLTILEMTFKTVGGTPHEDFFFFFFSLFQSKEEKKKYISLLSGVGNSEIEECEFGSVHQRSDTFSEGSRERQCVSNVLISFLYTYILRRFYFTT